MRRSSIAAGLVLLSSFGHWCTHAGDQAPPAARSAVPELMKREVSREGIEYLKKLRKNTPFGTNDFDLAALRAGMGSRRRPTIKDVKLIRVMVGEIPCEWVLAPGADPDVRLLYIHGGGFVSGSGGFYLAQAAHISAAAKCAVLLPDYRLAPEHRFPAGLEDCVLAHKWMVANGPAGLRPARATFVAGDSAGGSLTLATLLALRDRKMKLPAGGIALSPTTDLTLASGSLKTVSDPILSAKTMPVFRDHYLGKADPKNPLASPVDGDTYDVPAIIETAETRWRVHGLPRAKFGHREKFGNDPAKHRDFSAVTHVARDKGIPPFLILHVADHPDTSAQARRLGNVLKDAGVPATVFGARETTHDKINANLGLPDDPATKTLFEFFDKALKK